MPRTIAINGTRLDEVRMPSEPYGQGVVSHMTYPMSEFHLSRDGDKIGLVVPAYLAVELYRIGILPQDANTPVEISISGRSAGWYVVRDVRYPIQANSPFGRVTFTLTHVLQGTARDTSVQRLSSTEAATYVTDITHYLDETGELAQMPAPARKLASFLTLLIEAATGAPSARAHDSGIRCRTKACRGVILTSLTPSHDAIDWHCPVCGHNGVITGWENSKWNQLNRTEKPE